MGEDALIGAVLAEDSERSDDFPGMGGEITPCWDEAAGKSTILQRSSIIMFVYFCHL